MIPKRNIKFFHAAKGKTTLVCTLMILAAFLLTGISEAVPTGHLAYAVNGFDDNLGRFDWNLYTSAIKGTNELKATPLNHKGMYPAWGARRRIALFHTVAWRKIRYLFHQPGESEK